MNQQQEQQQSLLTKATIHTRQQQQPQLMLKLTPTKYQRKRNQTKQRQQQTIIQHTNQLLQQQRSPQQHSQNEHNFVGDKHGVGGYATTTSTATARIDYNLTNLHQVQNIVHTFHVDRVIRNIASGTSNKNSGQNNNITTTSANTATTPIIDSNTNTNILLTNGTKEDEIIMYNRNKNNNTNNQIQQRQRQPVIASQSQQKQRRPHTIATIMSKTSSTRENRDIPFNLANVRNYNYTPVVGSSGATTIGTTTSLPGITATTYTSNTTTVSATYMDVQTIKGMHKQISMPRTASPSQSTSPYCTLRQRQPQQQQAPQLVTITPPPRDISSPQHLQQQQQSSQSTAQLEPPQSPNALQNSATAGKYSVSRMLWRPPLILNKQQTQQQSETNIYPSPMLQLMLPPRSIPTSLDNVSTCLVSTSTMPKTIPTSTSTATIVNINSSNNNQSCKRSYNRKTHVVDVTTCNKNSVIKPTCYNMQQMQTLSGNGNGNSSSATISDGATPPQSLRSFIHTQQLQQQQQFLDATLSSSSSNNLFGVGGGKIKTKFLKHYTTTKTANILDNDIVTTNTILPHVPPPIPSMLSVYQQQQQQPRNRNTDESCIGSSNKSRNNNKYLCATQQLAASLPPGTQLHHRSMPTLNTTSRIQQQVGSNNINFNTSTKKTTLVNHSISSMDSRQVGMMQSASSPLSHSQQQLESSVTTTPCIGSSTIKFVNSAGTIIQQMLTMSPPATTLPTQYNINEHITTRSASPRHVQSGDELHVADNDGNNVNEKYPAPISRMLHERSLSATRTQTRSPAREDVMIVNGTQMTDELSARILQSMAQNSLSNRYQQQQQKHEQMSHLQTLAANNCSISCSNSNGSYKMLPITSREYVALQQQKELSATSNKHLQAIFTTASSTLNSNPLYNRTLHNAPVTSGHSLEGKNVMSILTATAAATMSSSTVSTTTVIPQQLDTENEVYHNGYVFSYACRL